MNKVRTFSVKVLPATNTLCTRIKIVDEFKKARILDKYEHPKDKYQVVLNYRHRSYDLKLFQAIAYIEKLDFNIVSYSEVSDGYLVHVDSHEYKPLISPSKGA